MYLLLPESTMTVMNMLPLKPSLLFRPRRLWSFAFRASSRGSASYRQPAAAFSTAAAVKAEPRRGGNWRADDTWPGLAAWRAAAVDERVIWGDKGAREPPEAESQTGPLGESLAQCARQVLMTAGERRVALRKSTNALSSPEALAGSVWLCSRQVHAAAGLLRPIERDFCAERTPRKPLLCRPKREGQAHPPGMAGVQERHVAHWDSRGAGRPGPALEARGEPALIIFIFYS